MIVSTQQVISFEIIRDTKYLPLKRQNDGVCSTALYYSDDLLWTSSIQLGLTAIFSI